MDSLLRRYFGFFATTLLAALAGDQQAIADELIPVGQVLTSPPGVTQKNAATKRPLVPREKASQKQRESNSRHLLLCSPKVKPLAALYADNLLPTPTGSSMSSSLSAQGFQVLKAQRAVIGDLHSKHGQEIKRWAPKVKVRGHLSRASCGTALEGSLSPSQIRSIEASTGGKIVHDRKVSAFLRESIPLIGAPQAWLLKDSAGRSLQGTGVRIGIIDTGVDYTHADLGGCKPGVFAPGTCPRVVGGYDFVNNDSDPMDDQGHGTHVAAIAAGKGTLNGVAPEALIYAIKVLDHSGAGYTSTILRSIDYAMDPNQDGDLSDHLDIVNMSLGGEGDPDDELSLAVDRASRAGVLMVIAAGNSGPGRYSIGSPGTARLALTVGATDKEADGNMTSFSSRGPVRWRSGDASVNLVKPDVSAPGYRICAAKLPGAWAGVQDCIDPQHVPLSGTSMATPHVAGLAALILQAHPEWTPGEVKQAIMGTAKPFQATPIEQGAGRIDALALASLVTAPPTLEIAPLAYSSGGAFELQFSASSKSPASYKIFVANADGSSADWTEIGSSRLAGAGTHDVRFAVDVSSLRQGQYHLKVELTDATQGRAVGFSFMQVDRFAFSSPLGLDIHRLGSEIPVSLSGASAFVNSATITFEGNGRSGKVSGGIWKTAELPQGYYTLTAKSDVGGVTEETSIMVYLEPTLRAGWPVRLPFYCENGLCPAGIAEPVVADLDGDGKKEILVVMSGKPPSLHVFDHTGALRWSKTLGDCYTFGSSMHMPIVGRRADGTKQVYVFMPNNLINHDFQYEQCKPYSEIFAFKPDGTAAAGFPVQTRPTSQVSLSAYDLIEPGVDYLVLKENQDKGRNHQERQVMVVKPDGTVHSSFFVPQTHMSVSSFAPRAEGVAFGNFDSDLKSELIIGGDILRSKVGDEYHPWSWISAYKDDGAMLWSTEIGGELSAAPVVADLDGDGREEVIANTERVEDSHVNLIVLDNAGRMKPGFPVVDRDGYGANASPLLGDLDNDGKLEIIFCVFGAGKNSCKARRWDGSEYGGGWPIAGPASNYISRGMALSGLGANTGLALVTSQNRDGVFAWTQNGAVLPGFPKMTEPGASAAPSVADLDGDGKAEVIASDWYGSYYDQVAGGYAWKARASLYVWSLPNALDTSAQPWPSSRKDERMSARFMDPPPPPRAPNSPRAFVVTNKTANSLTATWVSGGGTTNGFRIAIRAGNNPAVCTSGTSVGKDVTTHKFNGLSGETTYTLSLCAVNAVDVPSTQLNTSGTTLPGPAPTPTDFSVTATSESTITLAWVSGGASTHNFVIAMATGSAPTCTAGTTLAKTQTTHTFSGLQQNTTYQFAICARNSLNQVSSPSRTSGVTKQSPPPPPVNFKVVSITKKAIQVSWRSGGGNTTGFMIAIKTGNASPDCGNGTQTTANMTTHTFKNLKQRTTYVISLCSINNLNMRSAPASLKRRTK